MARSLPTSVSGKGIHKIDYDVHAGLAGIREYIKRHQPRYNTHGHQHINEISYLGKTMVIGVYGAKILDYETGKLEDVF